MISCIPTHPPQLCNAKLKTDKSAPPSERCLQTTDMRCSYIYKGNGRAYQHVPDTGVCIPEAHDKAPLAFAIPVAHDGYH